MEQFVTCGGLDCNVCSILETTSLIFRWLLGISAVLAALILIIGGFVYLLSAGKKNRIREAKVFINYTVSGFIFALIAFIAIHTTIWVVGGVSKGSWWKFECVINTEVISKQEKTVKIPRLATEIEDNMPVLTDISSLSELINSNYKIALLNSEKLDSENLRQDLLSMDSGDKIKLFLKDTGTSEDELKAFVKLSNGFTDDTAKDYNLKDLSKKFQNIADISKDDGDLTVSSDSKNLSSVNGSYWGMDPAIFNKLRSLVGYFGKNSTENNIVASKNARSEGSLSSCIDTGGDWKEFRNECLARMKIHGQENLKCSTVYNPTMGCECPNSDYLAKGVCVNKSDYPDKVDEIHNSENPDSCNGTTLVERTCPATRCEGNSLATYPPTGKDQCVDEKVQDYSCAATNTQYNATCAQMVGVVNPIDQQNIAKKDPNLYNQLKDYFNRTNPNNNPDNWGKGGGGSGGGNTGGGGGNTGGSGNTGGGGGRTGGGNNTGNNTGSTNTGGDSTPIQDRGPVNFNPTPSFNALAECLGFKDKNGDGKIDIPYNGVLVDLVNKDDPTNDGHPSQNASRMVYMSPDGNLRGNNGDINSGGLKVGTWSKGSGGDAWVSYTNQNGQKKYGPEWIAFNAQTTHTNSRGQTDPWSFKSGAGLRVGPNGEGLKADGQLNPNGKPEGMSGCNIHSGKSRRDSEGCQTCGASERKNLFSYVKQMATKDGGKILMASIPVENTDQNSQAVKSEYCGQMDPDKAIQSFGNTSQFRGWNPFSS